MATAQGQTRDPGDWPVGHDYQEDRESRAGRPAFEKAPPDACAIRPFVLKLVGIPPIRGELQGTLSHTREIAAKYAATFHSLFEWAAVEGDRI